MSKELSTYEVIGGEAGVVALVERFYDLMDSRDDVDELRSMHARSLKASRQKLFMFLSGWLGGPDLFVEAYGHPRLRARHLPFKITGLEIHQWLSCMGQAIDELHDDEALCQYLKSVFAQMAHHMRNHPDEPNQKA